MKQYNVMLKPASSLCNLRCRYCFYCDVADLREVRSFGIMTDETMQNVLRSLERSLSPGDQIAVISQGGEPMLAGLDFFRRFAARTDGWDPGISVSFALQTNGMLLDHDWCAFLKERRVLVGLSYDMLEDLHDGARVDASSRGMNRRVLESMRLLQKPAWSLTSSARSQIPSRAIRKRSGGAWSSWMCALCSLRRVWMRWKHRAKASMR